VGGWIDGGCGGWGGGGGEGRVGWVEGGGWEFVGCGRVEEVGTVGEAGEGEVKEEMVGRGYGGGQ